MIGPLLVASTNIYLSQDAVRFQNGRNINVVLCAGADVCYSIVFLGRLISYHLVVRFLSEMSNYNVTALKENLPRASGMFGICARNGIMPIQGKGKSGTLAVRDMTVPVRAKAGMSGLASTQRTVLKEIQTKAVSANVGTLCKEVTNISIRPRQENTQKCLPVKVLKPLQEKYKRPLQEKVTVNRPVQDKLKVSVRLEDKNRAKIDRKVTKDTKVIAAPSASAAAKQEESSAKVDRSNGPETEPLEESKLLPYSAVLLPTDVEDIDTDDRENLILVSDYVDDIYKYLRELEVKYAVKSDFLKDSKVTPRMRTILVNWLIDVHKDFHLIAETLYLAVDILDRFLQEYKMVNEKNLQLVGSTAMFLASKYEEMLPPEISDFVYISQKTFCKQEMIGMEFTMLQVLGFALGRPSPMHFLRRFSKAAKATSELHTLAKYAQELCLIQYNMCSVPPSLCAAAALYVALYATSPAGGRGLWSHTLQHYTQYEEAAVLPVARKMAAIMLAAKTSKFQAVFMKYCSPKFGKIALQVDRARLNTLAS
ncbi:G2/mitotic-specific cyclin-B-like [Bacillus rossius redtenbacheri]|uniref:G2/mitotic-specific cyclin-B-like n=1 Tax=Bacillus rossius redtenbacheri TaxID=93214 RepID=UPI002FDE8740